MPECSDSWDEALIDITSELMLKEQEKLVRALQESEAFLNQAQSVSQTGHWHLDIRSGALSWSRETYRIFGVPMDEPQTLEMFFQYIHPDDMPQVEKDWVEALSGRDYQVQHRIVRKDGEIRWVEERAWDFPSPNDSSKHWVARWVCQARKVRAAHSGSKFRSVQARMLTLYLTEMNVKIRESLRPRRILAYNLVWNICPKRRT